MSVDPDTLSTLLLQIYRASREQSLGTFQDAALDILNAHLPFDSCTWGVGVVRPSGLDIRAAHLYREIPTRYITYDEVKAQDTVAFATVANLDRTLNFHLPTLYAPREKAGMRSYMERVAHRNELVTTRALNNSDDMAWIALFRADGSNPFSEEQRRLCELVTPHLMEALTENRLQAMSRIGQEATVDFASALCDRNGFILHTAPPFADLLRREWPHSESSRLPDALGKFIASGTAHEIRTRALVIALYRSAGLVILKARERLPVDDLTPRELQVATQIALGRSHKEIARSLALSPVTIRNYTQRVHERLQVRNNVEVALKMQSFAELNCRIAASHPNGDAKGTH